AGGGAASRRSARRRGVRYPGGAPAPRRLPRLLPPAAAADRAPSIAARLGVLLSAELGPRVPTAPRAPRPQGGAGARRARLDRSRGRHRLPLPGGPRAMSAGARILHGRPVAAAIPAEVAARGADPVARRGA